MLLTLLICVLILLALVASLPFIIDRFIRSKGYTGSVSDHFDGTTFFNMKASAGPRPRAGFASVMKWMLTRNKDKKPWEKRSVTQTKPEARVEGSKLVATFINHATVLIQTEGLNIITDPIYAERASPFSFAGPRRFTSPGVSFEDLPHIDVILLSHNHYDHLDLATLKKLSKRDAPKIFAPLGNKEFLASRGMSSSELDWWESAELSKDVSITCVAAQHFSARGLTDRNKTLWAGYVMRTPHGDIYFSGDTGYGPFIDQIASRFPDGFRLGFLPIGAYRPEWFMKEVHVSPDEAFTMQKELNVRNTVAIHFGTFNLADDAQDEPKERVDELRQTFSSAQTFVTLPKGGSIEVP